MRHVVGGDYHLTLFRMELNLPRSSVVSSYFAFENYDSVKGGKMNGSNKVHRPFFYPRSLFSHLCPDQSPLVTTKRPKLLLLGPIPEQLENVSQTNRGRYSISSGKPE